MIDVSKETVIMASSAKMIGLGLVGVAMTFLCFAMAWPLLPNVAPGSFIQLNGWIGTFVCALGTFVIFKRASGSGRPTLKISPQGFSFNSVSSGMIPWHAVTRVGEWGYRRQRAIIVGVTEDIWGSPNLTRIARWSRAANKMLGADGLAIPASGMSVSFDEMSAIFTAYWQRYGQQPAQG